MKKFLATILSVVLLLTIIPMAYAESEIGYKVGDIIQFGSYPQSEVKDEALIDELNSLAPEWDNWTSYGYYSGNGEGSMVQGDWMRYTDVTFNDSKYRAVKFTQYRPRETNGSSTYSNQDNNGYYINTIYWFKFEPIDWYVYKPGTGLVVCKNIIDSQAFSNTLYFNDGVADQTYAYFNDSLYTNYGSDYETSSIREWLNNDFYNTAFSGSEKDEILISTLNNDSYYTNTGTEGYEALDSNKTNDKIFLPDFHPSFNLRLMIEYAQGSDYAKSQGVNVYRKSGSTCDGNSDWLSRTPGMASFQCVHYFANIEDISSIYMVKDTACGIRPALRLNWVTEHKCSYNSTITTPATHLKEGVETFTCVCGDTYTESIPKLEGHTYDSVITAPNCTSQGYTTYTCACGDSYISDYVNAKGHADTNGDYKCDNDCGYEFEKTEDPSKDCSCNCHKGGFMGFIWKIINFFQKLFKTNPVCSCGAKHW